MMAMRKCRLAARRAFSSRSGGSDTSLPLESGLPHLLSSLQRAFERRHVLASYQEKQVFPPLPLQGPMDLLTFLQLQMSQKTEIDLHEFLEGAAFAGRTQLMAANSTEFALFAAAAEEQKKSLEEAQEQDLEQLETAAELPVSKAAEQLEAMCSPHMYNGLIEASSRTLQNKNLIIDIQEMTVDKIFVARVDYSQFTEQDYEQMLDGDKSLTRARSEGATIEHLAIEVNAQTTEVHKMTLVGEEEALVKQQNFRRWLFESRVTTPDQLEWRILAAHGVNNSAREIAPRKYLKKGEKKTDASEETDVREPK